MINITIYTTPSCIQCIATKKEMDKYNIKYTMIDITKDEESFDKITKMGYKQAPVVITNDDHWSGYRPDKIKTLQGD